MVEPGRERGWAVKLPGQCVECRGFEQHKLSCSQRGDGAVRLLAQLREPQPPPKPRLGDYYAGLSELEWGLLVRSRTSAATVMAAMVFRKRGFGWTGFPLDLIVSASDAFAFGAIKYGIGCWREVSSDDHLQGAGRHFEAWLKDPQSKDDESGLLHEAHFLSRAIMVLEMRRVGK